MDGTLLPHVLAKLDAIREHQIKEGAAMEEVRHLLRSLGISPSTSPQVTSTSVASAGRLEADKFSKALRWLLSSKSVLWLAMAVWKHLPMIGTVIYMKATGQDEKIIAYLNGFLGI